MKDLIQIIENAFEKRAEINLTTRGDVRYAVSETLALLDCGKIRICEKISSAWQVNQWMKKAILLSFCLNDNVLSRSGDVISFDKAPLKFLDWNEEDFRRAGFRALPGSVVRYSAFIGKNVVLMPSFVNLGAYVDEGAMVDTWATIGSCAQIGKNCHISGGVGIGGVLEPLQVNPVIIEDDCFIGARSEIAEGVIVEKGSVISMGVYIGASTKIIDRESGEIFYGRVPAYSVVVSGNIASNKGEKNLSLYAAVIVKKVDEKTRAKTSVNELLRNVI
ncbi:MAG: 2,3,4,5-tetrahydropyridine-2,6-dicarboxylate N-succinyltransferase [Alphaproteobacteria bacterium RIFCSPLOWO2_01_FULL_40_26]|nr:MAG: 2,3,4,5-tetrahydropyridine-2,6-dicarboxylate N-succinyltransferase [Alphaproteobacteria bacterium RIFCSPHIGHO2_02_FULL_40_34]OFW94767.1 MAG: 2,3,4,5-tetrahydropyridine-2,6-dicarboxylate N-succinyltransferase [Alphaproteobacteria bacterium RIFCSPLOWO2_01_FULL_40_26]OFX10395.1 MAG: 2,3,4,5-tetrahydropyridine-2,6-dicarboxylate N-succinyltransferase [Alphaproteobacteria bacterium RIFCSPLOWO2_02_FULL_40_19]OFX11276.1 MAG: 2,3,4,5-tetrahydropyridine-2,6-dicarboxylate N-succinyltransferase [Alp